MSENLKPLKAPITVEKNYLVAGKRITFQVVFPASIGEEIGLENVYVCAQKILVRADSKNATVKELKLGE